MICSEVRYYLNDYSRGILLDEIRKEIHEHLNSCSKCTKAFDELMMQKINSSAKQKIVRKKQKNKISVTQKFTEERSSKNIKQGIFSSLSTVGGEVEQIKNSILIKANEIDNNKLFTIAGIISIIALGVVLAFIIFDRTPIPYWTIETLSGRPFVESKVKTINGDTKIGERLVTEKDSRARIKLGNTGEIDVEPLSEIQIGETPLNEHKLTLSKGKINVRTWEVPKFFFIETGAGKIKDLGCSYSVQIRKNSETFLQVESGWVFVENENKKSLLSSGTACFASLAKVMGTPFKIDASKQFKEALFKFDFVNHNEAEFNLILNESRQEDIISLFYLLNSVGRADFREKIYDRLGELYKIPRGITKDGIVNLDNYTLGRLWVEMGIGSISLYQKLQES